MPSDPKKISDLTWQQACDALAAGHVIAHPTETVFGLAADPFHPTALHRLLQLKGRTTSKGLIVLIPDPGWLDRLVLPPSPLAQRLMARFWPGPLTLVLPARADLPAAVTGESRFVAVRHSSSPLVRTLFQHWHGLLVSTSANRTGQPPACSASTVYQQWGDAIAVILAGETPPHALPSTLLQVEGNRLHLLREGAISAQPLLAVAEEEPFFQDEGLALVK